MVRYERLDIKFVYFLINLELRISCIQFLSLLGIRLSGDWMLGPCCGSSTGDDMGLDGSHGSSASMNPPQHFLLWGDLEFSSLLHQQHQWQKCVPSQGIASKKRSCIQTKLAATSSEELPAELIAQIMLMKFFNFQSFYILFLYLLTWWQRGPFFVGPKEK